MWVRRILAGLVVVVTVIVIGAVALTWRPAIDPIDPPDRSAFDPARIAKGAQLAAMGNCAVCHTKQGGESFSGGYPLETQFGTIHGTNITPDPETGIGRWSEAAFLRAMRKGIDREGGHLYPGFPYPHFTRMTDDDILAVYAYLMTREPVRAETPANDLPFPLNMRPLLAGWNLLFLDSNRIEPRADQSAEWNRGAYLVASVAHCGACHTPRNALGGERRHAAYSGGVAEGWHAPALNAASRAPVPWTADSLFAYLRYGYAEQHGAALGPMAPVSRNLSRVPEEDVRAIAVYVASMMGEPSEERQRNAERLMAEAKRPSEPLQTASSGATQPGDHGAAIYAGACATCHDNPALSQGTLPLHLSRSISLPEPRNLIQIIRHGIHPPEGEPGPIMPGFGDTLTEQQITELASYLRTRFSEEPAWKDLDRLVAEVDHDSEHAGNAQ